MFYGSSYLAVARQPKMDAHLWLQHIKMNPFLGEQIIWTTKVIIQNHATFLVMEAACMKLTCVKMPFQTILRV